MTLCPVYGQKVKINQNIRLNSSVPKRAIESPRTLRIWDYPPPEPPYIYHGHGPTPKPDPIIPGKAPVVTGGGGSSGMALIGVGIGAGIPTVIGGGLLGFMLTRHPSSIILPPISSTLNPQISVNKTNSNFYSFQNGEEILYNLVFKNTSQTPIYKDSTMYVKVPAWLDYKPESTYINNVKLTDLAADDELTYFKDDSLLVFNIGNSDTDKGISITFGAKVLTSTVSADEAFCLVKFQSVSNNYETDWKRLSVDANNTLPPVLQKVISTK